MVRKALIAAALSALPALAFAQTPMAPAKPAAAPAKPAAPAAAKPAAAPAAAAKPRSPAQIASAQRMKDCGAKWQQMKASNSTGGKSWQQFSSECLKKKA